MNNDEDLNDVSDIKRLFAALPYQTKTFYVSGKIESAVKTIINRYKLHIDKATNLFVLVSNVVLGRDRADELSKKIQSSLHIDEDTTAAIAKEVDDRIFKKIREALKNPEEEDEEIIPRGQPIAPSPTTGTSIPVQSMSDKKALEGVREKLETTTLSSPRDEVQTEKPFNPADHVDPEQASEEPSKKQVQEPRGYTTGQDPYREIPK